QIIFMSVAVFGQPNTEHKFTMLHEVKTTPVKSQGKTGTCWSFSTTSFLENELLRLGQAELDISEMFTVRHKLIPMAEKYIRYHGTSNFGSGGQAHDALNVIRKYGLVPEEVYTGMNIGLDHHNQTEMSEVIKGMLDGVLNSKQKLTPNWKKSVEAVLDVYLGTPPQKFEYNGKNYTPKSFAKEIGIDTDNYIELTSYTHQPFYEKFNLQLPDNWTNNEYYNVPINELIAIMDNSIKKGYSFVWDGDTGKDNFDKKECVAVIAEESLVEVEELEIEKQISQKDRQEAFESFDVTDDHLMNIVGVAENQKGTKFYYTKNSWGTKDKKYDGFWYMSEQYVRLKTVAILVHKEVIPSGIKEKLNIN
ncbi:MAG: C1 family peptidase, partial [Melioribacteraceae bacterium]